MKVFDSLRDKRWTGRGIRANASSFTILKSAKFSHPISLRDGNYTLKMVGRKRTGNGKFGVLVTDSTGYVYFNEEIVLTKSSWK
jgi:hypothetical protein